MTPGYVSGNLNAEGQVHAVVVSSFNDFITGGLLKGAQTAFQKYNAKEVKVFHVPGAFELGLTAKKLAQTGTYSAVTCLGCIIRGETDHYDFVAGETTHLIGQAGMETGVPVIFGVLTTHTVKQAEARCGDKNNKGAEAAETAIHMAALLKSLAAS